MVECQPSKLFVVGSNPTVRSNFDPPVDESEKSTRFHRLVKNAKFVRQVNVVFRLHWWFESTSGVQIEESFLSCFV